MDELMPDVKTLLATVHQVLFCAQLFHLWLCESDRSVPQKKQLVEERRVITGELLSSLNNALQEITQQESTAILTSFVGASCTNSSALAQVSTSRKRKC